MPEVITDHLDLWTSVLLTKSTAGRGSNGKLEAYGIKKLRELILELAVRGKLVPQDPNDEPASVLLERIAKEKSQLIREELIKKGKPLPEIGDDEKSFELPNGWEWSRLQDVSSYVQRGKGPRYADFGKVQVVSQKCIQWAGFDLSQARYVDDASLDGYQTERFLRKDDLLWNSTGTGTAGRINVVPEVGLNSLVADSHVTIIRPLMVSSNFLSCYVAAPGIQQRIEPEHENSLVSGTTNQVELNLSAVVQLVVPVPPLAEQHRIVAKVDELMALCDQLEQQQTDSLAAHQTLVETLLGTLTRVESQQEFSAAWARIARHLDTLFTTESSIDQLKQTILQLAVMGKLIPQDPNDEPASVMLSAIAEEKEQLVKEGVVGKQKQYSVLSVEEELFAPPAGWQWVRLDMLFNIIVDCPHSTPKFTDTGLLCLDTNSFKQGSLIESKFRYVDESTFSERIARLTPDAGDIVFAREGSVGESVVLPPAFQCCLGQRVMLFRPSKRLNSEFLRLAISSPRSLESLLELHKGIGAKHVNVGDMRKFAIALPPAAEQHRIVAKVDELMALCDALKACLADVQVTQRHLADAIVEQAVC